MTYKTWIKSFLLLSFISIITPIVINYAIDPYQIIHRHNYGFYSNSRIQNAGLINSYLDSDLSYDSVIIGTSMTENFIPSYVSHQFQWKGVLKLSNPGASSLTQKMTLERALETKKVKHVIWGVDHLFFSKNISDMGQNYTFPSELYSLSLNRYLGEFKYLTSKNTLNASFELIQGKTSELTKDLDTLYVWDTAAYHNEIFTLNNSPENLKSLKKEIDKSMPTIQSFSLKIDNDFPSVDANLLSIIKAHRDVDFYIFIPPYGHTFRITGDLNRHLNLVRYLVEHTAQYNNVKIFAFDTCAFAGDFGNYMGNHYSKEINQVMIDLMAKNQNQLTKENFYNYENKLVNLLKNYKIFSNYGKKELILECEQSNNPNIDTWGSNRMDNFK